MFYPYLCNYTYMQLRHEIHKTHTTLQPPLDTMEDANVLERLILDFPYTNDSFIDYFEEEQL